MIHNDATPQIDVDPETYEVRADGEHIYVKGRVDHGVEDKVIEFVKNISGVTKVTSDLYSVSPEAFLGP